MSSAFSSIRPAALCLLLSMSMASGVLAQPRLNQGPTLHFAERSVDFGEVPQESEHLHVFEISNRGTAPLIIREVESSCGCTAAVPERNEIAPGERTGISVTFKSEDFEGAVTKVVVVRTNDPAEPRADLVVRAFVVPFIEVETDLIDFGRVKVGEEGLQSTVLSSSADQPFEVVSIEGGESYFDFEVVPVSRPGRNAYRLDVRLKPIAPMGKFSQRIILRLDHPQRDQEKIIIQGTYYSHFIPAGQVIRMGQTHPGTPVRKEMPIEAIGDAKYEITGASSDAPYLQATVAPTVTGYLLSVTVDASQADLGGEPAMMIREWVTLHTTDPAQPAIPIRIRGSIRS